MKRCRRGSGTKRKMLAVTLGAEGRCVPNPFNVAAPPGDPSRVFVGEASGTIRLGTPD